jgi:hypothetical protein
MSVGLDRSTVGAISKQAGLSESMFFHASGWALMMRAIK